MVETETDEVQDSFTKGERTQWLTIIWIKLSQVLPCCLSRISTYFELPTKITHWSKFQVHGAPAAESRGAMQPKFQAVSLAHQPLDSALGGCV